MFEVAAVLLAHAGLAHHERLEAFLASSVSSRLGCSCTALDRFSKWVSAKMEGTVRIWSSDSG